MGAVISHQFGRGSRPLASQPGGAARSVASDRAVSDHSPPLILDDVNRFDVLNGARGIWNGVLIGTMFWCTLIIVYIILTRTA